MGHLYHGYVSHNQRVSFVAKKIWWSSFIIIIKQFSSSWIVTITISIDDDENSVLYHSPYHSHDELQIANITIIWYWYESSFIIIIHHYHSRYFVGYLFNLINPIWGFHSQKKLGKAGPLKIVDFPLNNCHFQ